MGRTEVLNQSRGYASSSRYSPGLCRLLELSSQSCSPTQGRVSYSKDTSQADNAVPENLGLMYLRCSAQTRQDHPQAVSTDHPVKYIL